MSNHPPTTAFDDLTALERGLELWRLGARVPCPVCGELPDEGYDCGGAHFAKAANRTDGAESLHKLADAVEAIKREESV